MIGKSQGKTEISLHLSEWIPQAWLQSSVHFRTVLDFLVGPTPKQRGQTSICGNSVELLPTKIELG